MLIGLIDFAHTMKFPTLILHIHSGKIRVKLQKMDEFKQHLENNHLQSSKRSERSEFQMS